ncbi:MAG: hypothetical protein AAGJ50_16215, partial [Pseudomonadota bacterium]
FLHGKHSPSFGLPATDTPLRIGFLTRYAVRNPFQRFDCPSLGESVSLWNATDGRIRTWTTEINMSELTSSAD